MPLLSVRYDGLVNRTINFRISAENNLSTLNIQFLFLSAGRQKKASYECGYSRPFQILIHFQ